MTKPTPEEGHEETREETVDRNSTAIAGVAFLAIGLTAILILISPTSFSEGSRR